MIIYDVIYNILNRQLHSGIDLETFAMDDGGSGLVVFLLGDPHLLERGQRSQNGSTDPDRVLALRRGDDFDLHRRRGQRRDLLLHPVGDASVQDRVGAQILVHVDVALHDRIERTPSRGCRPTPFPRTRAGTGPRGSGSARCRSGSPDRRAIRTTCPATSKILPPPFPSQSPWRCSTASP